MEKEKIEKISNQIEKAKVAVLNGKCSFYAHSKDLVMEFMNLGIGSSDEIWPLISELLGELKPEDRTETDLVYNTTLSPHCEFFTFVWDSERLKKKTKLTFALNTDHFYYFSLS